MVLFIKKRDGKTVNFDKQKIVNAVMAAMKETGIIDYEFANFIADSIHSKEDNILDVEQVQDLVEDLLMNRYPNVARKYILYRNSRTKIREMKSDLMKHIKEKVTASNIQSSNANIDEMSFGARKNEAAGELTKAIAVEEMLDPEVKEAWENNLLYIHDMTEYVIGQHNCLNVDLYELLSKGFYTRNGGIRPARSFATACQLVAVIFQANSQCHFGGAASVEIDTQLAPFVRISFLKHYENGIKYTSNLSYEDFKNKYNDYLHTASINAKENIFKNYSTTAYQYALDMLEKEGNQAAQALYHNLNSLESRPGSQLSFVSMCLGLDTSFEGRCVTRWLLMASLDGIGAYHLAPIFPISIFRYKKDINDRVGTPNYDLFKLAITSTAKRIFPNYVNTDWISNKPDIHPTFLISKPILSADISVDIYNEDSMDKPVEYNLRSLVEYLRDVKKYPINYKDDMFYIDLRFVSPKIYIQDMYSEFNEYCVNSIEDHFVPINYISYTEDMLNFAITTSSFRHDFINEYGAKDQYQSEHFNYKYKSSTEMATMGSCDGEEIITYKISSKGRIFQISFEELWNKLAETMPVKKRKLAKYIDLNNYYVFDTSLSNFTRVKRIICNEDIGVWNKVIFNNGDSILLTDDHPLPTQRGRIFVKDLKKGDRVSKAAKFENHNVFSVTVSDRECVVESIEHLGYRNRCGYDLETESDHFDVSGINSYNCRTLIGYDRHGLGWDKNGRGNVVPVTMNITKLGIQYGICLGERTKPNLIGFERALHDLLKISEKSLLDRYKYISSQSPSAAYFMYDNGTIVGAEESKKIGNVEPSMKHNTLSIGFIGLANTLYALFGKYHNQSEEVKRYGLKIVETIYNYTKSASVRNDLNFSCYFTPAESCCYTIMKKLQKEFGIIKGVTDHEYLVNSIHVPVYEKISIKDKIDLEAQFDWMGTAGNILYVELDANIMNNLEAIEEIIKYAMDKNDHKVAYFAINFPIDNCLHCGYSGVIEDGKCPVCGASGDEIQMLRRVTGYLTADYKTRFNKGKKAEVEERIKHSRYTNMRTLLQN